MFYQYTLRGSRHSFRRDKNTKGLQKTVKLYFSYPYACVYDLHIGDPSPRIVKPYPLHENRRREATCRHFSSR